MSLLQVELLRLSCEELLLKSRLIIALLLTQLITSSCKISNSLIINFQNGMQIGTCRCINPFKFGLSNTQNNLCTFDLNSFGSKVIWLETSLFLMLCLEFFDILDIFDIVLLCQKCLECRKNRDEALTKMKFPAQITLLHAELKSRVHKYILYCVSAKDISCI